MRIRADGRRLLKKLVSAGLTVLFFALVRPGDDVPLWIASWLSILFYEGFQSFDGCVLIRPGEEDGEDTEEQEEEKEDGGRPGGSYRAQRRSVHAGKNRNFNNRRLT